jgi:hypothetical protein
MIFLVEPDVEVTPTQSMRLRPISRCAGVGMAKRDVDPKFFVLRILPITGAGRVGPDRESPTRCCSHPWS